MPKRIRLDPKIKYKMRRVMSEKQDRLLILPALMGDGKGNIQVPDTPNNIWVRVYDQVLIFRRGDYIFVFNFNPFMSFQDYGFETEEGNYKIILNSDDETFLGQGRINTEILYKTSDTEGHNILKLYIPVRTCFVLEKRKED